jgi:hypothetical protein
MRHTLQVNLVLALAHHMLHCSLRLRVQDLSSLVLLVVPHKLSIC